MGDGSVPVQRGRRGAAGFGAVRKPRRHVIAHPLCERASVCGDPPIDPLARHPTHCPHGPQATKEKVEALLRIAELKAAAEGTGVGRGDSAEDGVAAAASPAVAALSPKGAHPAAKVADKAAAAERKGWFGSPLRG